MGTEKEQALEQLRERREALRGQLEMMRNHLAEPQRTPSFGTRHNREETTQASIDRVEAQIAELDRLLGEEPQG